MLDLLERFIRSQLNSRAICVLAIAFIVCGIQFSLRNTVLDHTPDGQIFTLSKERLKTFICDPRKPKVESSLASKAVSQQFKTKPPTAWEARHYYAATEATTDVAFPIVYGTSIGLIFWWLFGQSGRALLLIPLGIVIADFTENATFIWLALTLDCKTNLLEIAVWPNWLKWSLTAVAALVTVYGIRQKSVATSSTRSS